MSTYEVSGEILSAGLEMGPVTLRVGDLEGMSRYYAEALALEPLEEVSRGRGVHRALGRGDTPLLRLIHTPDLPAGSAHEAGLYHTAFVFEDARSLAATVYQTASNPLSRFEGSSDHLVSEAFYFTDPEGNGIELYTDRPRQAWSRSSSGVEMATLWLDPNKYLGDHLSLETLEQDLASPGRVGHVHLQVGDIPRARQFYVETLGFEPTAEGYPGALFASAGGYHHHVAMNTWRSRGAGPRAARLGLADLSITVPTRDDLDALVARLQRAGIEYADEGQAIVLSDPWGTQVTVAMPDRDVGQFLS